MARYKFTVFVVASFLQISSRLSQVCPSIQPGLAVGTPNYGAV